MSDTAPDEPTPPPAPRPKPKGITCVNPTCTGGKLVITSRRRPLTGLRVRYALCRGCGWRMTTKETVTAARPPKESVPTSAREI